MCYVYLCYARVYYFLKRSLDEVNIGIQKKHEQLPSRQSYAMHMIYMDQTVFLVIYCACFIHAYAAFLTILFYGRVYHLWANDYVVNCPVGM